MAGRKGQGRVNEQDFRTVKALVEANLSFTKISKIVGRSGGTVGLLARAESLEEYRKLISDAHKRWSGQAPLIQPKNGKQPIRGVDIEVDEPQPDETVPEFNDVPPNDTWEPEQEETKTDMLISELGRVADALERMATAWESKPQERSLFGKKI